MRYSVLQEQTTLPVGATIQHPDGERYVVVNLLGKGGFGAVYLVRGRHAKERLFALKEVIDPNTRDRERFIFEAEVLKRLNHRALPHVYQVFEYEKLKRVYMLMDYIEGRNLDALLGEQPERNFSLPLVLAIMKPIVDALIYLHGQNPPIVHRDIKPSNIIVSTHGGEAVLVDFGLAKEYIEENTTTIIRHGSPGYAAPEQYGSGTNPRTDIYGFGATLYTLLTGTIPIDAITRATGSKGIDPLVPVHLVAPSVPWANAMAIEKAMSISSVDRFNTIEEFWQELTIPTPQQQVDTPRLKSLTPDQQQDVPEQDLKRLTSSPPALLHPAHVPKSRKQRAFLPILLAIVLAVAIGAVFVPIILRHSSTPIVALSTPQLTVVPASSPPATLTSLVSEYPTLVPSYAGTVLDLMNGQNTDMFLTQIHQNSKSISGNFRGLGLVGPFTGTVTPAGHLKFTVLVQGGASTLAFEGDIKIGGDIVGTFMALNQNRQPTGESGPWNLSANQK
jgi:eukaryotic-like serine/threonine-protein kinase